MIIKDKKFFIPTHKMLLLNFEAINVRHII